MRATAAVLTCTAQAPLTFLLDQDYRQTPPANFVSLQLARECCRRHSAASCS